MKKNVIRYIMLIGVVLFSVLIFFKWFVIEAVGTTETHSFMTIPGMLSDGADFLTQLGGKSVAVTVIILGAVFEYMCVASAALGIWGSVRSFMYGKKSRLVYASQVIAVSLTSIAAVTIILINIVSYSMLGGIITVIPTIWFALSALFLILSIISSKLLNSFKDNAEPGDENKI